MTPARRIIVRTSLVTSSTIATVLGAQSLALIDLQKYAEPANQQPVVDTVDQTTTLADPTIITNSAPSITIFRRPSQVTNNVAVGNQANQASQPSQTTQTTQANQTTTQSSQPTAQIMPPAPVSVQPATVSMPQRPTSRSSR